MATKSSARKEVHSKKAHATGPKVPQPSSKRLQGGDLAAESAYMKPLKLYTPGPQKLKPQTGQKARAKLLQQKPSSAISKPETKTVFNKPGTPSDFQPAASFA